MMPALVESVASWLGRGVEMLGPGIVPIVMLPIVAELVVYRYSPLSLAGLAWLPLDAGALQQGGLASADRATHGNESPSAAPGGATVSRCLRRLRHR